MIQAVTQALPLSMQALQDIVTMSLPGHWTTTHLPPSLMVVVMEIVQWLLSMQSPLVHKEGASALPSSMVATQLQDIATMSLVGR